MSFEPNLTAEQAKQHQAWKAARERLRAPETLLRPKLVISNPPPTPVVPSDDEIRRELMDFTIAAVANVAGLVPMEVLEGLPTVEICNARNLAMALCAYRHRLKLESIAEYFGVHQKAVTNAAKSLSTIMIELSISTRTPLELVLPTLWPRWIAVLKTTSVADIQSAVCEKWGISKNDLISHCRSTKFVVPRHAAMALSRKLTPYSMPEIGRRFNGRDHTSVLHAVRKFEGRVAQIDLPPLSPVLAWVNRLYDILQDQPLPSTNGRGSSAPKGNAA